MKRLIILLSILVSFTGCAKHIDYENDTSQGVLSGIQTTTNISETKPFNVSIKSDVDTYEFYSSSVRGITLTPKLQGSSDKEIVYHWTIDSDTEMFDTKNGPQKEITKSGEPVLFVCIALINYVKPEALSKTINVTLTVEEKTSNAVLAKTHLIIEDYSGTYKIKK